MKGKSAFPVFEFLPERSEHENTYDCTDAGMTRREWFIGQAIAGLSANRDLSHREIVAEAFAIANMVEGTIERGF